MTFWIDPGHGPGDGCQWPPPPEVPEFVEHQLVFRLATMLQADLHDRGQIALLSREAGEDPTLRQRAQCAKKQDAAQAILLHFDVTEDENDRTPVIYHRKTDRSRVWESPLGCSKIFCTDTFAYGRRAANCLMPYDALWIPALLVEVGYLSCPAHQDLLRRPDGLMLLSLSLAEWLVPSESMS